MTVPNDLNARNPLAARYRTVRRRTEQICEPLEPEDYVLQSMPDCSPPKWHLAHTSWFFETFVLATAAADFRPFHPQYCFLFNSYYDAVGARWPRPSRGLLSRPTIDEVRAYRRAVDEQIAAVMDTTDEGSWTRVAPIIELGLNHEEQHQELLLTDLKHAFGLNPLRPGYACCRPISPPQYSVPDWLSYSSAVRDVGHDGTGFAFDNEGPRHRYYVAAFEIRPRPVTCGEYLQFIADRGYDRPELWLADGWAARQRHGWNCPLYWCADDERERQVFTLRGQRRLMPDEPVCHISFYEADAFARWADARLPTEQEWETAAGSCPRQGSFLESENFHPAPGDSLYGDVWSWTASPYTAYPGYRPASGALGEYNGKFMCNQMVLRGGSCATPADHIRPTYRNFFPPEARWQFSGIRLAKDSSA